MVFDYTILIHRLYDKNVVKKGGLDLVIDYLVRKDHKILVVEFPLNYGVSTEIRYSQIVKGTKTILGNIHLPITNQVICWFLEFFLTFWIVFKYKATGSTVITSDPLTSFPAVILRKLGKFRFHYFHAVDFSTNRFPYKLLNFIYIKLLVFCLKNADLVTAVTARALERIQSLGVPRISYLPNSMDFHSLDTYRKSPENRRPYSLVLTCSEISGKYLVREIVMMLEKLKIIYPSIHLNLIGRFNPTSDYSISLLDFIKTHNLELHVTFYGQVSREKNYELVADSTIGLAFYDGAHSHVMFGDALKIREYAALGIPTVADTYTPTAVEMAACNCGYTVDSITASPDKIKELLDNPEVYARCVKASLDWSLKYDKRKLLDDLYKKYLEPKK